MNSDTQRAESAIEQTADAGISRRQVMKAGAWAAPVVVLAAAVPAAAASVGGAQNSVTVTSISAPEPDFIGIPGIGYTSVSVTVRNNSTTTSATVIVALTHSNGAWSPLPPTYGQSQTLNIPAGGTVVFTQFRRFNPGANGSLTATATVTSPVNWSAGTPLRATTTNFGAINASQ